MEEMLEIMELQRLGELLIEDADNEILNYCEAI